MAARTLKIFSMGLVVGAVAMAAVADAAGPHRVRHCPQTGKLRVAMAPDVSASGVWRRIIARYPDPVEVVEVSPVADLQDAETRAAAQAVTCPEFDVYALDVVSVAEYAAAGLLRELPPRPGLVERAAATGRWRGRQYALPFTTDVGLLYRRAELPEPRTWVELWAAARAVRTTGRAGLAAQLADYEGGTVNLLEMIRTRVVDRDGDVVLDEGDNAADAARALSQLAEAGRNGDLGASWSAKEADSLADFAAGKAGYLRHWPYAYHRLVTDGRVDFEVSPLPGTPALGGTNLAVDARSGRHEQALEFVEFLLRPDNQRDLFACGGYAPVVEAAYRDVQPCSIAGSADSRPTPSVRQLTAFAKVLQEALARADRPSLAHYARFSQVFRQCVTHAVQEENTSEQRVRDMADALRHAVDGRLTGDDLCG
ncbi:extracellular solute-binding protein [Thermoactinospora rubra]|uniref:extracellular solute-binding protein n=1 Tax=Thermoactinospora rubra TaxID=1088767 RepID=UPI000A107A05|nr:extracellular solute-binding protein [Thermoactinospora rubra]